MDRKKILLIGPASPHLTNHYNRISKELFEIKVISNKRGFFEDDVNLVVLNFSLKQVSSFLLTPKKIASIHKEFHPDVIHIHQVNSYAYFGIRGLTKFKIPIIVTAWGSDILINPKESSLLKHLVKYVLKRAQFLTSDSLYMADEMRKLVPKKKLDIEICNFGVKESDLSIINKQNLIYSNRTHNPLYNIDKVIKTFNDFLKISEDKSWHLLIAGKGSETLSLKKLVIDLGISDSVSFVGFLNEKQNLENYAKARFFISLPKSDATAMSLLEAMYYKCIPIVSDLPANREWVTNNENGIVLDEFCTENPIHSALSLNFEYAENANHIKIKQEGTIEVSEKKFNNLLLKAINR
ncbi:MAG: glycosyltransferase family 4 protein [Lishizhenia sp.]